jgi:hypothetical protein
MRLRQGISQHAITARSSFKKSGGRKIRRLFVLGNILIVIGILVVFSSTVLPLVKLPQTLNMKGPSVALTETTQYWIDTIILPTIDNDTLILLNLKAEHGGGIGISIIPYRDGAPVVGEMPIINYFFEANEETITTQTRTIMRSEYFVSIVSIRNNYILTISSVWSPYDSLRAYLYLGLCMFPAGLLIIHYDRIVEKRDHMFQSAMTE